MSIVTKLPPAPKDLTLLAIITIILATSTDAATADELRTEFYIRFRQKLYDYCLTIANKNFGNSTEWNINCEDITQDTFVFAVYNLDKFKFDPKWTEKKLHNHLVSWLGSIAEHKLFDLYNKDRGKDEDVQAFKYDLKKNLQRAKTANAADIFQVERVILDNAMQKLKTRDKDILYTYLKHGCLQGTKHLPDAIMADLCQKWDITAGNARVIKSRTFELLKKLCLEQKTNAAKNIN